MHGEHGRLNEKQQQWIDQSLAAGPQFNIGKRLAVLSTLSGTASQVEMLDNEKIAFGSGTDAYMSFDATNVVSSFASERLGIWTFPNAEVNIGAFHSTTQGSGIPIDSNSGSAAFRVYADDDGTALQTTGSVSDRRAGIMRTLITAAQNAYNVRAMGAQGLCKIYNALAGDEEFIGTQGVLELVQASTGTLTLSEYGIFSGVSGRVSTSGTVTIGANNIVAGVSAISNMMGTVTQTGKTCGLFVGGYDTTNWSDATSRADWGYGLYIDGSKVSNGIYLSSVTLATAGTNYGFYMECTSASTNASNSVESMYVKQTMTGPAGVGGRARFHMYTAVALGGWANALKGYAEFAASGRITGLASAICAELKLPNENLGSGGAYFPLEIEYVAAGSSIVSAGSPTGNRVGFIYMAQSGDASGDFDTNGYLFQLAGMTAGANNLFRTGLTVETLAAATSCALRIAVGGVNYYIPLATATA